MAEVDGGILVFVDKNETETRDGLLTLVIQFAASSVCQQTRQLILSLQSYVNALDYFFCQSSVTVYIFTHV